MTSILTSASILISNSEVNIFKNLVILNARTLKNYVVTDLVILYQDPILISTSTSSLSSISEVKSLE